jgi:hypothetical protein
MSHRTLLHDMEINKDKLLDLFLNRGEVIIDLEDQTITLLGISNRQLQVEDDGIQIHTVNIIGTSSSKSISHVDGKGTIKILSSVTDQFKLSLELHLHD